jgi:5-deoxy-glucuronate isomerase
MTGRTSGSAAYRPAGSSVRGEWDVDIDPASAGWEFSGIRIATLAKGAVLEFGADGFECIVVPLEGAVIVTVDGQATKLEGRENVFTGPTDVLYVPCGSRVAVESIDGGRFALPLARSDVRHAVQYVPRDRVPSELRGAGAMSRRVFDFGGVNAVDAQRLIACEVITPGGNWSSYPPHKHDEATDTESELEEIYYFEVQDGPVGPGSAYQRVSSSPGHQIDVLEEVRSGDVVLIPHGWHGPAMAAPGYDLYYLNVMAGPGAERVWGISDHPEFAWVRELWPELEPDPRLVLPTPEGTHGAG